MDTKGRVRLTPRVPSLPRHRFHCAFQVQAGEGVIVVQSVGQRRRAPSHVTDPISSPSSNWRQQRGQV
jgi:hypothetical protein